MSYEKWSPGYWLLKSYIKLVDWFIHKKIIVVGKENVPSDKPIVFAPNHQNALSDPMALVLHLSQQPVWLARADIFGQSKTVDALLRFMKILPVYRIRDGIGNLEKNDATFYTSVKILENNASLALFPEAAHTGKRQIKAHKKAVPRIVFMAEEKTNGQLDIQIIPTGIHYSHYWKFNRVLLVNLGKPVKVKDFYNIYVKDAQEGIRKLREAIYDATLPLIVNFRSALYYDDFEHILKIYGHRYLKRSGLKPTHHNLFKTDQVLANSLDQLEAEKPEETKIIVEKIRHYYQKLKENGLKNRLVKARRNYFPQLLGNLLLLVVTLPLYVYGLLFNALPFFMVDRLVRTKVKDQVFWSSYILVAAMVLFPVFYLLQLWAVSGWLPGWPAKIIFLLSLPFVGKLAFNWYILLRKTIGISKLYRMKWFNKVLFNELVTGKEAINQHLDQHLKPANIKH
jgi:1-acyl-sn-glycerol-3-phosphate acyltransferase